MSGQDQTVGIELSPTRNCSQNIEGGGTIRSFRDSFVDVQGV
jgi:hypothetical protein